jgi:hypothetical protein
MDAIIRGKGKQVNAWIDSRIKLVREAIYLPIAFII